MWSDYYSPWNDCYGYGYGRYGCHGYGYGGWYGRPWGRYYGGYHHWY